MADATWLADVLRADGLRVLEMAGWKSRGTRPGFDPVGIVCHHTATGPDTSDVAVRTLLVKGRPDLKGPLSQLGLERDGTFVTIAAGRCNHNGFGLWGNDSIGIEAYNDGRGERWPDVQMSAYRRGCAAICRHMGWGTGQVRGHKETDPNRKIDPTFDMVQFRAEVAPLIFPPKPKPPTVQEDDDMPSIIKKANERDWWIADGFQRRHVKDRAEANGLALSGQAKLGPGGEAFVVADVVVDRLKIVT